MITCNVCDMPICKYILDFNSCGGMIIKEKRICHDCAKLISMELIEDG